MEPTKMEMEPRVAETTDQAPQSSSWLPNMNTSSENPSSSMNGTIYAGDRVVNSGMNGTIYAGDRVVNSGMNGTIDKGDRVVNSAEPLTFYQKWMKWYYVLPVVFLFFYVIMLGESFADSRRNRKKDQADPKSEKKVEGMETHGLSTSNTNIGKIRSIMRREDGVQESRKRVSFQMNHYKTNLSSFYGDSLATIREYASMIYELWLMPWIYLLIRTTRMR